MPTDSDLKSIPNAQGLLPIAQDKGRMNVEFNDNYLVQNKALQPNNNKVVNIYVVYELDVISSTRNIDYTIQNALFGAIRIGKNDGSSKNKYKGYDICFDEGVEFSIGNIVDSKNVIVFGVDESSVNHANNKANNIYVMGKYFVQGINDTTLYAEKLYKINFIAQGRKFVLSLHYNGDNSYLFVNGTQELKFKAKDDQIFKKKLCLGNLNNDWATANSARTDLYRKVYDFVVDYEAINGVRQIYDMRKYLMKKHVICYVI